MAKEQPQTVTQFAVQEGNLDGDDPQVQGVIEEEKAREKRAREHAEAVADVMAGDPPRA